MLQERYADGIDLSDYREIKRFRAELCKITGENPNLAYSQKTIQEIIKANGWSNGSKVIPYSFSKSAQKKTSNRNKDVPVDTALIQELERYRNDYCVWFINRYGNSFESYWKTLKRIFNDASKNGIVDKTFDLSDLRRIRNDLFALPKYPAKLSSARETYLFALDRFIDFWTKSFPDNVPEEVKPNDAEASVEEEEEPERPEIDPEVKSMLLQDFESRRDDYYQWFVDHYSDSFNDYWQKLEKVVDDAIELGILDDFLNDDALEKIETELLSLPKYQRKAFSSKWIYPRAVKRFIQFWNDQSTHEAGTNVEEQDMSSGDESDKRSNEVEQCEVPSSVEDRPPAFENYKEDFCNWLANRGFSENARNLYWNSFEKIINDSVEHGIIVDSFNVDDLDKIGEELFSLPEYQSNSSIVRYNLLNALKYYIQFVNDNSLEEDENGSSAVKNIEERLDEIERLVEASSEEDSESFDTYKDAFCRWLTRQGYSQVTSNAYWKVLKDAIVDAIAFGFIKNSFERDDLNKVKTDLLSLPEYQAEVFPSRADCLFALKRFTEFLNERSVDSWKDNFSYDSGKPENSEEDESANEEDVENDEEGLSLAEFKDDFCSWLENHGFSESSRDLYWNCFINIANDAFERGIISEPIDDAELRKIKKILLALPEYQEDVYPARYDCLNALGYFIQFWDEDPFEDDEEEAEFTDIDSFDEGDHNEQASQINERHSKKSHSRNIKNLSFNDHKIDFYFWLQERDHSLTSCNLYWDSLIGVLTEANKKELISKPVDVEVLKKLKENLSSLPQHENKVFTSRSNEIKALDYFIEFWNDCSNNKQANSETVTETTIEQPDDRHTAHKTSQEAGSFFQKYKDGFFNWLVNQGFSPSACELYRNSFEIFINEAFRQKFIADSFKIEDIGRIGTTLFSLPQYQFDVFPHRTNCIYALKYFVKFLKSNSFKQSDDKRSEDENTKDLLVPNMKMDETPSEDDILPFESYRDDFVQWLKRGGFSPSASKLLGSYLEEIIDAAVKHNIIVDSFDVDGLNRIEAELFALPKYQANVFPWRNSYMNALSKFIDFWNEDSDEETSDNAKQIANDDSENETSEKTHSVKFNKWDFTSDLEPFKLEIEKRTVEVSGGWKGLYVAVFEQCNSTYKRLFRKFYNRELSDYQNGVRRLPTFFINKPVGGVYVSLSDGKYVNINLTPDMFIDSLKRLLSTCVIYPKDVRAFFHKKVQEETATSIVLDSVKEEVRKEINKADASLDKKTQGRGADIREKFVEWLGKKIPSKETVEVYKAVLPDLEKFCKKQADPAFVLFETLDSKIIGQFTRRERRSFRTTIPPYAFSILNFYKRFLEEHAQLFQSDAKPQTSPVAKIDVAPKEEPVASSVASGGFPTKRLGEPWLEPAKKVIEQVFSDRKICGYAELKNFRRLLQEEANDPNVASMSKMRETALFRALNVSYVESASPERPRGSLKEAEASDVQKTVDVSDPQKLNKAVMLVLNKYFSHGIDVHCDYDLRRFREIWRKSPYALNLDDYANDKLGALIVSAGIRFQGRVYTINRKAWTFITVALKKATNDALPIIYMSTFFESHKTELNQLSCHNYQFLSFLVEKHMMKDLVGYKYRDGRIVREHEENENETIKSEILRVWGDRKGVNVYWLKNQLQYVPLMEIERVLKQETCFIYERSVWYRIEDLFDERRKKVKPEQSNFHIDQETIPVAQPEAPCSDLQIDQEAVLRILQKYYDNGFLYDDYASQWQFIENAEEEGESIFEGVNLDDDLTFEKFWRKLEQVLKIVATRVGDKYYVLTQETKDVITGALENAFQKEGVHVIYTKPLFELLQLEAKLPDWIGEDQLLELMQKLCKGYAYKTDVLFKRITKPSDSLVSERDLVLSEINRAWAEDFSLSYEQLQERLPYIPFDEKIKPFLSSADSGFIFNGRGFYARRDFIEIPDALKKNVQQYVKSEIAERGYVPLHSIPIGDLPDIYEDATDKFLQMAIFELCLENDYSRDRGYIVEKGRALIVAVVLKDHFDNSRVIRFVDARNFHQTLSQNVASNDTLALLFEFSLRINKDAFVPYEYINFDIEKIDKAILQLMGESNYMPLKWFASLSTLPETCYPWNLFLLETYCRKYSKKLSFDVLSMNSSNVGIVKKRTCSLDYHQVMIDALSKIGQRNLNREEALSYLCENGFIATKHYSKINDVIKTLDKQSGAYD